MNLNPELQTDTKHIWNYLAKRLKYNERQTVYTACMICRCLSELKQIYNGNKKLSMHATKHLFTISYVYFFIDLFNLATIYYRVSYIIAVRGSSQKI